MKKTWIAGALAVIFVVGAIITIVNGRPVAQMRADQADAANSADDTRHDTDDDSATEDDDTATTTNTDTTQTPNTTATDTATTTPTQPGTYTMAEVAAHATASDCWSAINGSVYDLSSWVSRHPGGANAIVRLCGNDGSAAFNRQHGSAGAPQSALILLKIGTLAS